VKARFEVIAAQVMGVALPVLEIARRRTRVDHIPSYVDDLLAGALLLFAAQAARRGKPHGDLLLSGAWGVVLGGVYYSFFSSLAATSDVSGIANHWVIGVKGLIFAVAATAFVLSIRHGATSHIGGHSERAPS
jgi:hypothetical protein